MILPGLGHWCWLEDTDQVAGRLVPFLRNRLAGDSRVEAFRP